MSQAQDAVGSVVEFNLLSGPMVVNTPEGEFCADAGHVVVRYDGQKPLVLTLQQFTEQFTEI